MNGVCSKKTQPPVALQVRHQAAVCSIPLAYCGTVDSSSGCPSNSSSEHQTRNIECARVRPKVFLLQIRLPSSAGIIFDEKCEVDAPEDNTMNNRMWQSLGYERK